MNHFIKTSLAASRFTTSCLALPNADSLRTPSHYNTLPNRLHRYAVPEIVFLTWTTAAVACVLIVAAYIRVKTLFITATIAYISRFSEDLLVNAATISRDVTTTSKHSETERDFESTAGRTIPCSWVSTPLLLGIYAIAGIRIQTLILVLAFATLLGVALAQESGSLPTVMWTERWITIFFIII
ncbi:hypothetical protein G7Y89_g779 [Cudoniella acicularis]|uniref:Uncharacterized protein n=1 Tax=Cudoniella acicularis TaxID=354080 RepID=A0A8H4RY74_9HELO|nr:hypothetical protein G7Y89_g779 [Cudoniella acicularis]